MPIIARWSSHMRSHPSSSQCWSQISPMNFFETHIYTVLLGYREKKEKTTQHQKTKFKSFFSPSSSLRCFSLSTRFIRYICFELSVCVPIYNIFSYYILPYILELACRLYAYALDLIIHQHHGACVLESTVCAGPKENVKWNQIQSCSVCMRCVLRQLCAPLHHQFSVLSENSVSSHLISFCVVLKSSSELTEPWISRLEPLKWE